MGLCYSCCLGKPVVIWEGHKDLLLGFCRENATNVLLTRASFVHQPLKILPGCFAKLYHRWLKKRHHHTASHAILVLDALVDIGHGSPAEHIRLAIDFDGSVHIRLVSQTLLPEQRCMLQEKIRKRCTLADVMDDIDEVGVPKYHHHQSNCKHFMERLCTLLFGLDSFESKYLRFLHRTRKIR